MDRYARYPRRLAVNISVAMKEEMETAALSADVTLSDWVRETLAERLQAERTAKTFMSSV